MGSWTRQPPPGTPIDWDNPLTEGLVACWPLNGTLVDLVKGNNLSASVHTSFSPFVAGMGLYRAATASAGNTAAQPVTGAVACSVFSLFATTPGSTAKLTTTQFGTATTGNLVSLNVESGVLWARYDGFTQDGGAGFNDGGVHSCLWTSPGGGNLQGSVLYGDGISVSVGGNSAFSIGAGTQFAVGWAFSSAGAAFNGFLGPCYVWARTLTANEAVLLNANPWQLFWKRQRTYSLASSGGGVTALAGIIESLDAIAATATLSVSASAAVLEASDAIAAAAHASVTASAAILAPSDAIVAMAASGANASGTILEGADSFQATATASTAANGAITETADSIAASATASTSASAAILESSDTISAIASTGISASALILESADSIAATASLSISALAAFVESPDVIVARATASVSAAAAVAEGGDSIAAFASVAGAAVSASAAIVEQSDIVSGFASASLTPDPCMMVYLPTRNLTATLPTRNLTANLEC